MKISIIIPAYNASNTICDAISSVLTQETEHSLEVLVIDDHSTDDTFDIAMRIAETDSRVLVSRNGLNRGVSATRNILLDRASGEWIMPLDADDEFLPGKIARLLSFAEKESCHLIYHDLAYLNFKNQPTGCLNGWAFPSASAFSRSALGSLRFPTDIDAGEDTQFFSLLELTSPAIYLPEKLGAYRILPGSLTDRYWLIKRIIPLWHQAHPESQLMPSRSQYLAWFHEIPVRRRAPLVIRWLGQKWGRLAGAHSLLGNPIRSTCYAVGSLALSPKYILNRLHNYRRKNANN